MDARKVGRSIDGPLERMTPDPYKRLRATFKNCGWLTGSDLILAYRDNRRPLQFVSAERFSEVMLT